jgi:Domain of unknown function (DUF4262)
MGLAHNIQRGHRYHHSSVDAGTFQRAVTFLNIPKDEYSGRLVATIEIYGGLDFRVLQVVTPDAEGRFPWDSQCDPHTVASQPLLGGPPDSFGVSN